MIWQDVVLTTGSAALGAGAFLSLVRGRGAPLELAVPYVAVLLTFSVTYATLDLWFTTSVTAVSSLIWMGLAWQTVKKNSAIRLAREDESAVR